MNTYDKYISLVIAIKLFFVLLAVISAYLKYKGDNSSDFYKNIMYFKERIEFIFIVLMALLLIYLFNPIKNKIFMIDHETKILFFTFGIVLLITSKWSDFIHESKLFNEIQNILGTGVASE